MEQKPMSYTDNSADAPAQRPSIDSPEWGEHDMGPWQASEDGREIASDDFCHDVVLKVNGDFYDDAQRKRYADNLVARLNATRPNASVERPSCREEKHNETD